MRKAKLNNAHLRLIVALGLVTGSGAAQTYRYDAAGRLVRVLYPQGGGVAYLYDAADNIVSAGGLSVPPAPGGVEIGRADPASVRVSWSEVQGAAGYRIERRPADGSAWEQIAALDPSARTYIDLRILSGQDYVYRVSAVGPDGAGAFSPEVSSAALQAPRPEISANGVVDGASFSYQQGVAPGSLISVFGSNIGVRIVDGRRTLVNASAAGAPLPLELAGHSVLIDGRPAPLYFVAGRETESGEFVGQINAQVPWQTPAAGPVPVVVRRTDSDGTSESMPDTVRVVGASPALFTFEYGAGPAVAINVKLNENDGVVNGSVAQPPGSLPGIVTQPARSGGVITLLVNGLGAVDPPGRDGHDSLDALRRTVSTPRLLIGGVEARILFAGLTPQFVAVYQINAVVPEGVQTGDRIPVQIEIGQARSREGVTIAVQP